MSDRVGLHWVEERDAEIDDWVEKIRQLVREKQYEEAVQEQLLLLEKHHETAEIFGIAQGIGAGLAGRLKEMNSGASWAMLSKIYYWGLGGVEADSEQAIACATKASELGCAYGEFNVGCLSEGEDEQLRHYTRAAEMGSREACWSAGNRFRQRGEWKRAVRFYLLAGSKSSCRDYARRILRDHPYAVTSWGEWSPTDPIILKMVMHPVFQAQRCWMTCAKRLRLPRYVALIVASFICTEPGWE